MPALKYFAAGTACLHFKPDASALICRLEFTQGRLARKPRFAPQ